MFGILIKPDNNGIIIGKLRMLGGLYGSKEYFVSTL